MDKGEVIETYLRPLNGLQQRGTPITLEDLEDANKAAESCVRASYPSDPKSLKTALGWLRKEHTKNMKSYDVACLSAVTSAKFKVLDKLDECLALSGTETQLLRGVDDMYMKEVEGWKGSGYDKNVQKRIESSRVALAKKCKLAWKGRQSALSVDPMETESDSPKKRGKRLQEVLVADSADLEGTKQTKKKRKVEPKKTAKVESRQKAKKGASKPSGLSVVEQAKLDAKIALEKRTEEALKRKGRGKKM